MRTHGQRRARALFAALLLMAPVAGVAFTVSITPALPTTIYLQVGVGSFTGGTYKAGGQPANNPTINKVTVTVPAAAVGTSAQQAMTTDSTAANSFYDGFAFCNLPNQLYIGGFYRTINAMTTVGTVTATVPAALMNSAGDTISFSEITWTTGGNGPLGDSGSQPFVAGTFAAGTVQTVGTIAQNHWAESCWTFSYLNTTVPPAGTYTGRVIYTLTAP